MRRTFRVLGLLAGTLSFTASGSVPRFQDLPQFGNTTAAPASPQPSRKDVISWLEQKSHEKSGDEDLCFSLGLAYTQAGMTGQAISALRRAVSLRPDHLEAWLNLGASLASSGENLDAAKAFKTAVQISPENSGAWNGLGAALMSLWRLNASDAALQTGLRLAPNDKVTWNNLGLLRGMQGRFFEAGSAFSNAIRIDPSYAVAWYNLALVRTKLSDWAGAEASYAEALRLNGEWPEAWHGLIESCLRLDRPEEALTQAAAAQAYLPNDGKIHYLAAVAECRLDHWQRALDAVQEAGKLGYRDIGQLAILGHALVELNRFNQADAVLQELVSIAPDNAGAWNCIGRLRDRQHRPDESTAAWFKALSLRQNDTEPLIGIGGNYLNSGNPVMAIPFYKRAAEINPDSASAWLGIGLARMALGENQEAAPNFEKAATLDPDSLEACHGVAMSETDYQKISAAATRLTTRWPEASCGWVACGRLQIRQEHWIEAEQAFRKASGMDDAGADAWDGLAAVLRHNGKLRAAIISEQHAIRLAGASNAGCWARLAESYAAVAMVSESPGDWRAAENCFRHYVALRPGAAAGWAGLALCQHACGEDASSAHAAITALTLAAWNHASPASATSPFEHPEGFPDSGSDAPAGPRPATSDPDTIATLSEALLREKRAMWHDETSGKFPDAKDIKNHNGIPGR